MSYLNTLRFHFSGKFFSNPSTINNAAGHYENQEFNRDKLWLHQDDPGAEDDSGLWNPMGAHAFKLVDVKVRTAFLEDGSPVNAASDNILSLNLESQTRNPAKMVDLDTDQQLVSTIFGLKLTLTNDDGEILLDGMMDPAPFTEIWARCVTGGGDEGACAAYQSVIAVSNWGDLSASPFLSALKAAATDNLLSVKFQLDGYSMNRNLPNFATGRIVGTIAAASVQEPRHFTLGRHFDDAASANSVASPGFRPKNGVNFCMGIHDTARKKFRLDLGNALRINPARGPVDKNETGKLFLGCKMNDGSVQIIDSIAYEAGDWYDTNAGITEVPAQRELTAAESDLISSNVLCIVSEKAGVRKIVNQESNAGACVRADMFVARMNPGDTATFNFYATKLGQPLAGAAISIGVFLPAGFSKALQFPSPVVTDGQGFVQLEIEAEDPGNPRFYYGDDFPREHIDGQYYKLGYGLNGRLSPNPSDKLSIVVYNHFTPDDPITWFGSARQIMKQYGDLYPVMTKDPNIRLDLADYDQIVQHRLDIIKVLNAPLTDPRHMPVSRDLSRSRREALLKWLDVPAGQKPLLGTAPVAGPGLGAHATMEVDLPLTVAPAAKNLGGKTIFAGKQNRINVNINLEAHDQD